MLQTVWSLQGQRNAIKTWNKTTFCSSCKLPVKCIPLLLQTQNFTRTEMPNIGLVNKSGLGWTSSQQHPWRFLLECLLSEHARAGLITSFFTPSFCFASPLHLPPIAHPPLSWRSELSLRFVKTRQTERSRFRISLSSIFSWPRSKRTSGLPKIARLSRDSCGAGVQSQSLLVFSLAVYNRGAVMAQHGICQRPRDSRHAASFKGGYFQVQR